MAREKMTARALFERQMECLLRDDREAQMRLYAPDCVYEFPFATDRPRRIEGRREIARVMTPLWEESRRLGVEVRERSRHLYETTDPDVIVAEFTLAVTSRAKVAELPFVQVLRARDGFIVGMREYFSPQARDEFR